MHEEISVIFLHKGVKLNILLIDDNRESLKSLQLALSLNGFKVSSFESPDKAIEAYDPEIFDAVLTDYHFPKMEGDEVVIALKQINPDVFVVVISGDYGKEIRNLSMKAGAFAFFRKPIDIRKAINKIKKISKDRNR